MRRCPLCTSEATAPFYQDRKRAIYRCKRCMLLFADASSHLPPSAEVKRYRSANSKDKPLQQFLSSLITQCEQQVQGPLLGLNFGRLLGPQAMSPLEARGHKLKQYDPHFAPDHTLLRLKYDFICCYRVFEHFRFPGKEWQLLCSLLKPGGWMAISTQLLTELQGFPKWHHKNNLTHVSFYQEATFQYLASQAEFRLLFASKDLILVQKPTGSGITRDPSSLI
ncbi:class I SAM-dependent methyltransferase [Shewanella insulae]|uniref:methyltransferase domain-containing protein n=1 Tax=Shewanella insulae TaxID=2681496 RepID=UPI001EFE45B7|nr:methyltransferase domain-containing protein [Shewanella insulae]MCG9737133.1 class I SAM-dependent methyltransferase [Shewanella insulae]